MTLPHAAPALALALLATLLALGTAGAWLLSGSGPDFPAPPPEPRVQAAVAAPVAARAGSRLDLNRVEAEALQSLPGIGPVLARRIVAHREARGPFRRAEDLLGVPGIGPSRWERLQHLVGVGAP